MSLKTVPGRNYNSQLSPFFHSSCNVQSRIIYTSIIYFLPNNWSFVVMKGKCLTETMIVAFQLAKKEEQETVK